MYYFHFLSNKGFRIVDEGRLVENGRRFHLCEWEAESLVDKTILYSLHPTMVLCLLAKILVDLPLV